MSTDFCFDTTPFREDGDDPEPFYARALYGFTASNPRMIDMQAGDALTGLRRLDGWWKVIIGDRCGLVPATYCDDCTQEVLATRDTPRLQQHNAAADDNATPQPSPLSADSKRVRALHDFSSSLPDVLNFAAGDEFDVLEGGDAAWYNVRAVSTQATGFIPIAYTESVDDNDAFPTSVSVDAPFREGRRLSRKNSSKAEIDALHRQNITKRTYSVGPADHGGDSDISPSPSPVQQSVSENTVPVYLDNTRAASSFETPDQLSEIQVTPSARSDVEIASPASSSTAPNTIFGTSPAATTQQHGTTNDSAPTTTTKCEDTREDSAPSFQSQAAPRQNSSVVQPSSISTQPDTTPATILPTHNTPPKPSPVAQATVSEKPAPPSKPLLSEKPVLAPKPAVGNKPPLPVKPKLEAMRSLSNASSTSDSGSVQNDKSVVVDQPNTAATNASPRKPPPPVASKPAEKEKDKTSESNSAKVADLLSAKPSVEIPSATSPTVARKPPPPAPSKKPAVISSESAETKAVQPTPSPVLAAKSTGDSRATQLAELKKEQAACNEILKQQQQRSASLEAELNTLLTTLDSLKQQDTSLDRKTADKNEQVKQLTATIDQIISLSATNRRTLSAK